jgi:LmbE family N-acetylglucosaminyl deacetylase
MNTPSTPGALRILGVFAYPDDETFCAGGTFAKYIASGAEVMVVSATHGEAGQIRSPRVATRRTLAAVREQELRQACQSLGVQNAHVVAAENVTCQVFSPEPPTAFLGRGEDAHLGSLTASQQATETAAP